jgi:hypothetical protein
MLSFSLFTFHFDFLNSSDEIFAGIMRVAGEEDQEEAVLLISMIACFGKDSNLIPQRFPTKITVTM